MGKMTRHQVRKRLIKIIHGNQALFEASKEGSELKYIYRDIMFIAKILNVIEHSGPKLDAEVEIEID